MTTSGMSIKPLVTAEAAMMFNCQNINVLTTEMYCIYASPSPHHLFCFVISPCFMMNKLNVTSAVFAFLNEDMTNFSLSPV